MCCCHGNFFIEAVSVVTVETVGMVTCVICVVSGAGRGEEQ